MQLIISLIHEPFPNATFHLLSDSKGINSTLFHNFHNDWCTMMKLGAVACIHSVYMILLFVIRWCWYIYVYLFKNALLLLSCESLQNKLFAVSNMSGWQGSLTNCAFQIFIGAEIHFNWSKDIEYWEKIILEGWMKYYNYKTMMSWS